MTRLCLSLLCLCALLPQAGCGVLGPRLDPTLDPVSREMVVALREPVVYVRAEPGLSVSARDYLYLGPVEGNVAGDQRYYLWVGMAGTIDRAGAGLVDDPAYAVALDVDGFSLELPLADWHDDLGQSPFEVRVPLRHSMRATLTSDQLARIARADGVALSLITVAGQARDFAPWRGDWSAWANVADDAAVGFGVEVLRPGATR
ncbi:MAG: hypothetical protein AAGI15_10160 [Pseudomonadota bacterium]